LAARLGGECRAFINNGAFAVGIDLNPGESNKYVMVGDFHALQFADSSIDVAYTNCIDHAFDISKMMAETRRVLKPGGLFIAEIMRGLHDEQHWQPDDYDCAFWDKTDDIIKVIAEKLGGANVTHREPIQSRAGWAGDMIVFKLSDA
jgi:ubiquinone/menaquinone biosynthesis C-methylase UbiE